MIITFYFEVMDNVEYFFVLFFIVLFDLYSRSYVKFVVMDDNLSGDFIFLLLCKLYDGVREQYLIYLSHDLINQTVSRTEVLMAEWF